MDRHAPHTVDSLRLSFGYKENRWQKSGYQSEVLSQICLMFCFLGLYGCTFSVPFMVPDPQNHILLMTSIHMAQLCIMLGSYIRSTYWCALLNDRGYLRFPPTVSTARKSPLSIFVISASLLNIFLAWTKRGCGDKDEPCILTLNEHEVLQLYLGVEAVLVCFAWLLYILQVVWFFRRVQLPDVAQDLWKEREFLTPLMPGTMTSSSSRNPLLQSNLHHANDLDSQMTSGMLQGDWVGGVLSISDAPSRGCNDVDTFQQPLTATAADHVSASSGQFGMVPMENLHENQGALLRYLKYRNNLLTRKVYQLTAALHDTKALKQGGTNIPAPSSLGVYTSMEDQPLLSSIN